MSWIINKKVLWRAGILLLWLIAFSGPWGFDSIHVPGEFACSDPWVRYTEQLCAATVSGGEGFAMLGRDFIQMVRSLSQGETIIAGLSYLALFIGIVIFLLAPIFNTLLSLAAGNRRKLTALNLLVWLPTLLFCVLAGILSIMFPSPPLWGLWLMAAAAGAAIFLEWRALAVSPAVQLAQ